MPVSQPLIRTFLLCLTIPFLITACSSGSKESSDNVFGDPVIHGSGPDAGGDGFDVLAPEVNILFPPPSALTGADSLTVTGTANDITATASITVNGVRASSDDGFLTWRVRVPLNIGLNTIEVTSADSLGNRDTAAATTEVVNNPTFAAPQSIAIDNGNNQLVLVDSSLGAVLALDLESDQRRIISSDDIGTGPSLAFPVGVVVDQAANRAIVVNASIPGSAPALFAVDLATGNRRIISDATNGTGPPLETPDQVALDATGTRALVTQTFPNAVFAIDLDNGDRTLVSDGATGPVIDLPGSVTVDAAGRVLVVDVLQQAVIAIDLTTGTRSFVSGGPAGSIVGGGPPLAIPNGISIDSDGQIIVSDVDQSALYSIDPVNGNRVILSEFDVRGTGDAFVTPLTLVADAGRSYVVDTSLNTVFSVDNANGNREPLSVAGIGSGVEFVSPFSIDIDRFLDQALVTDVFTGTLYAVSLNTGERSVISDVDIGIGVGPGLGSPSSIAVQEPGSSAIVMDSGEPAVFSIDLENGDRTILSDFNNGGGDDFISPLGAALDTVNNRLLVANPDVDGGDNNFVLNVALGSGDRSVISRGNVTVPVVEAAIGAGQPFSFPQNIAVDSANQIGYVVDSILDSLVVVDLNTGDRTTGPAGGTAFPRITNNSSLPSALVQDIALTSDEAIVTDSNERSVYGFNTVSGALRVISDADNGVGTALQGPVSVALDPATGTLYVVDAALFAVMAIEPVSGDRVIVSR